MHKNTVTNEIIYNNFIDPDSPFPENIETHNLILKRVHSHYIDIKKLHSLFKNINEDILKNNRVSKHNDMGDTVDYLNKCIEYWKQGDIATYIIIDKDSTEYVGTCSMNFSDSLTNCEICGWFKKSSNYNHIGEKADAFIDIAFNEFSVNYVESKCILSSHNKLTHIKEYIRRYNGEYTGITPDDANIYKNNKRSTIYCHQFIITKEQYESKDIGLKCNIPGISIRNIKLK